MFYMGSVGKYSVSASLNATYNNWDMDGVTMARLKGGLKQLTVYL